MVHSIFPVFPRAFVAWWICGVAMLALAVDPLVLGAEAGGRLPTVVYGWYPARFGTWNTKTIRWDLLSHLCYRGVEIKADGSIHQPLGPRADADIHRLVDTAHRNGVKVCVVVWVANRQDSDSYLAAAPRKAAEGLLAYVQAYDLDGVNIDDEMIREENTVAKKPSRELVTEFFRILRRTFDGARPGYHLSYAAPPVIAANDRFGAAWLDVGGIAAEVDAVIPMGYTVLPPSAGWTSNPEPLAGGGKAGHTTTRDLSTMAADYLRAMKQEKSKLLIGVSADFGGYAWRCRTDQPLSPILARGERRSLAQCERAAREHGRRWHEAQASPWYVAREGDAFVQGWYNDVQAWNAKLGWIRQQQLGGIGIWVLDGETDPPERWQVVGEWLKGYAK